MGNSKIYKISKLKHFLINYLHGSSCHCFKLLLGYMTKLIKIFARFINPLNGGGGGITEIYEVPV